MMGWTKLPTGQRKVVDDILRTAARIRKNFDTFVVLGIGGSALGPIAVQQALNHLHYNELSAEKRNGPVSMWRTTSIPSVWRPCST